MDETENENKARLSKEAESAEREEKGETVVVELDALKSVIRETVEETVTERLTEAGVGKVDRKRVAIGADGEKLKEATEKEVRAMQLPYGGGARLASPTAPLYRALPEWEREFRNEDTDYWGAEWFRAASTGDVSRQLRAHTEIDKIFGRDLNTTSDAALIPAPIAASVMELKRKIQKFGSLPNIQRFISESGTLKVPKELTFASVQKLAEAAAATPDDPTFGAVTLTKKNSKIFTVASMEMLEDTPYSLVQLMTRGAARSIALEHDLQDVKTGDGTGENQTSAILTTTNTTTFGVSGTITYLEVNKLYRLMESEHRSDAVFIGNNTVAGFLDDVTDANGRPMFSGDANSAPDALEGGQGGFSDGFIKRRPFLEIPISTDELILASPSAFMVLEGSGIRAEVSRDIRFLEDQIVYKWVSRRDGAIGQAAGFAKTPAITAAA
jgi:HK97 family phage major capsid protein